MSESVVFLDTETIGPGVTIRRPHTGTIPAKGRADTFRKVGFSGMISARDTHPKTTPVSDDRSR